MLSEKMDQALNQHLNREFESHYIYLGLAAYFANLNLDGFAHWYYVQAQEEMVHIMKFYNFILERGAKVKLAEVPAAKTEFDSPLEAVRCAYDAECSISNWINELVALSVEENDHATNAFLQWFVTEQVEEEANADAIVQQLKLVGDSGTGVFMLDREVSQRADAPPAPPVGSASGTTSAA